MKIGLIAVDGHSGFPNLALMRLSAWHKAWGDEVEWWNGFTSYGRVYKSKVFTFTPDMDTVIRADEIITGGTGYRDYGSLPPHGRRSEDRTAGRSSSWTIMYWRRIMGSIRSTA